MRTFKQRFVEHKTSFSTPKKILTRGNVQVSIKEQIDEKRKKSELAAHVWALKDKGKKFRIEWRIIRRAFPYRNNTKNCDLCVNQKTCIGLSDPKSTLNSRNEILHKCRNKTKFSLASLLKKPP